MQRIRDIRGYTLLEVLFVLAIAALLMAIIVGTMMVSRNKANDSKRLAEMKEIELALRAHLEFNGAYPTGNDVEIGVGGAIDGSLSEFLSEVPNNNYWYDDSFDCDGTTRGGVFAIEMNEEQNANFSTECPSGDSPPGSGDPASTYVIFLN